MSGADAGQLGGYRSQTQVLTMRRWSLNVLNDRRHDFEVRAAGGAGKKTPASSQDPERTAHTLIPCTSASDLGGGYGDVR